MKHDKLSTESESVAMPAMDIPAVSPAASEACFLADRAAEARAGMFHSLVAMKDTLLGFMDVSSYAERHPWVLAGSAGAAGVAAALLSPRRRKRVRRSRRSAVRFTAQAQPPGREPETTHSAHSALVPIAGTVLAAILPPLLQSLFAPAAAVAGPPRGDTPSSGRPPDRGVNMGLLNETGGS